MGKIPTTRASTNVAKLGGVPRVGQSMNIHTFDAMYNQNIRSIDQADRAVRTAIGQTTKAVTGFIEQQQAKEDKINLLKYQDSMNDAFNGYTTAYRENPDFDSWGQDYEKTMDENSKITMDELKMSNRAREMAGMWSMERSQQEKRQIASDYSAARINHFDKESTFLIGKAVEKGDTVDAIVNLKLRAENSPTRTATLEADIKQAKDQIWWNNEVEIINEDPHNWKEPAVEDVPGGRKGLNNLKAERSKVLYQEKVHFNERKQTMFTKLDDLLMNGELTTNTLDEYYYKERTEQGLPVLNKRQYDAYKADLTRKDIAVDKASIEQLRDDIYYYDSSKDDDKSKWTAIQDQMHFWDVDTRQKLQLDIDKMTKRNETKKEVKQIMTPAQDDAFDRNFGLLDEAFNVKRKEAIEPTSGMYRTEIEEPGAISKFLFGSEGEMIKVWDYKKSMQARDAIKDQIWDWAKKNPEFTTKELQDYTKEVTEPYAVEKQRLELIDSSIIPQKEEIVEEDNEFRKRYNY